MEASVWLRRVFTGALVVQEKLMQPDDTLLGVISLGHLRVTETHLHGTKLSAIAGDRGKKIKRQGQNLLSSVPQHRRG
jgi:hypothetical protein